MLEFNKILTYREYYKYDFKCEAIQVKKGKQHDEAEKLYSNIVRDFSLEDTDKWAFDIALDYIRTLKEEDLEIINKQGEILDFHFGPGLYIRNKYIHLSKLHGFFIADNVSARVEEFISAIMFPEYKLSL